MMRIKVDEMHSLLFSAAPGSTQLATRRESELERAIRKARDDLDRTKSSVKSQLIKDEFARAVEMKS